MKNNYRFWWIIMVLLFVAACSSQSVPQTNENIPTVSSRDETEESPALQVVPTPTEDKAAVAAVESAEMESDSIVITENEASTDGESIKEEALNNIGDALIALHRSGGFAGVDEQWLIYADGRIEGPEGVQQQVEPEQVQALLETITTNEFFALDDSYVPLDSCCDRFSYELTVRLDNNQKTVRTVDDAPDQPQQLTQILNAVNVLLFASK